MKSIHEFSDSSIKVVFTDIDGTLTHDGRIPEISYSALWKLHDAGIHVVPVTGRPAGWCEMIARTWPVLAVIGENGGFYFQVKNNEMKRRFHHSISKPDGTGLSLELRKIQSEILNSVPGTKVASDQFARLLDLAIDFAEDVVPPLDASAIQHIVHIFKSHGAHAKVSNIHVNGWFGDYDKRSMVQFFLKNEFPNWDAGQIQSSCAFVGDSPNDEELFGYFKNSFGVQNVVEFLDQMKHHPSYICDLKEGDGFNQVAHRILEQSR